MTRRRSPSLVPLGLVLALAGCSDATTSTDAASSADGAAADTAAADTGRSLDASDQDVGAAPHDAASADAVAIDASTVAPCTGQVVFDLSFQSGSIPAAVTRDEPMQSSAADPRLSVVAAPWDPARRALQMIARVGDDWHGAGYPRTEVTPQLDPRMMFGHRYCFEGAFQFDTGSTFPQPTPTRPGTMVAPLQIHGRDGISPVFAFEVHETTWRMVVQPGDPTTREEQALGEAPVGRRVRFQIEYVPSYGNDGYVGVAIDGVRVLDRHGVNHSGPRGSMPDGGNPDGGFVKLGLYDYWSTIPDHMTLFLDDVTIREE